MRLLNRRAIVTGASQGFGLAVAKAFAHEGASVLICARSAERLESAAREIQSVARGGARVAQMRADVARSDDVTALVEGARSDWAGIDILVCNAGIYGPKGPVESVPLEEWSEAVRINLMGVVLPCRAVLPEMKQRKQGKIILLSGGGATKPLPFLSAYAASKAAVVRFGETLAEEVRESGVAVNAVAPGMLNTRLLDEVLDAGPEKVGRAFYETAVKQKAAGGTPLERGAALCVYLASDESAEITGKLLAAVWDPWETLSERLADIRESDIYTLRRIVPADRGKSWGG
jgi:NAD(P)-dependent dehydrogenase (short-subunit alcohol dehydrogenase family)